MNFDINKVMASLGIESYAGEEHLTEEQEMLNEIALEAELDQAFADMDSASISDVVTKVELINVGLAEREISLESSTKLPEEVYAEFGLEAIKDVAARHAYAGLASIKSLINTVISWFKTLVGLSTSAKKIFGNLAKKAKAENKSLSKYAGRDMAKLKRTMPDYNAVFDKIATLWDDAVKSTNDFNNIVISFENTKTTQGIGDKNKTGFITKQEDRITNIDKLSEDLKEVYDKGDTTEQEGTAAFNAVRTALNTIESKTNALKSRDMTKDIQKLIDRLQKVNKELDKKNLGPEELVAYRTKLNKFITRLNKEIGYFKAILKEVIKVADDTITAARGIQAAL